MIEEAAGTKLYESKKESAQKTIEKKDAKLIEIDTVSYHLMFVKSYLSHQVLFIFFIEIGKVLNANSLLYRF